VRALQLSIQDGVSDGGFTQTFVPEFHR
jgi:hypothetical protein